MVKSNRVFQIGMVLLVLISTVGLGLAADAPSIIDNASSGSNNGMKITLSTFAQGMSFDYVKPILPMATLLLSALAFFYGFSAIAAMFVSSTKTNVGIMVKNNDLRSEGHKGHLSILGGAILMAISFVVFIVIWNNYGMGVW